MKEKKRKSIEWQMRVLSCYLALNDTALYRKGLGLSYTKEDILPVNTAKQYMKEFAELKRLQRRSY